MKAAVMDIRIVKRDIKQDAKGQTARTVYTAYCLIPRGTACVVEGGVGGSIASVEL